VVQYPSLVLVYNIFKIGMPIILAPKCTTRKRKWAQNAFEGQI
jgi:hypothetical protein